jgi:rubrerythrin
MPEFVNPFPGMTPEHKLTARELTRALRMALSAEEEAIHQYQALSDATDDPLAKAVLDDIANEERVHKGEFQRLINILLPDEANYLAQGAAEVDDKAAKVSKGASAAEDAPPSIGSMKS